MPWSLSALIRINPQDGGVPKHHFLGLDMTALEAIKTIRYVYGDK